MNRKVFKSTFPLHEGRYDKDGPRGEKSDRRVRFDFLNIFIIYILLSFCILSGLTGLTVIRNNHSGLSRDTLETRWENSIIMYLFISITQILDWAVFCMARVLQPDVDHSSNLWLSCFSLWSLDCHELGYQLCRVSCVIGSL